MPAAYENEDRVVTHDSVLQAVRDEIACAVVSADALPPTPLPVDRWVASSALQKAVRRGETLLALRAGLTYLSSNKAGFWRRLPVIAAEDVGVGDSGVVTQVITAAVEGGWRRSAGGDWRVASYLVARMCEAPKERSTDYLLLAALAHPDFEKECARLALAEAAELVALVRDETSPLPTRAVAAWYLAGTGRLRGTRLPARRGEPEALFAAYGDMGAPRSLVAACRSAAVRTQYPLPVFLPLVWSAARASRTRQVVTLDIGPPRVVRGMPLWAFDKYTPIGRQALRTLLASSAPVRTYLAEHLPKGRRLEALGVAVFYVEGGEVRHQLVWDQTEVLTTLGIEGDLSRTGLRREAVRGLLQIVRENLGDLDRIRVSLMAEMPAPAGDRGLARAGGRE